MLGLPPPSVAELMMTMTVHPHPPDVPSIAVQEMSPRADRSAELYRRAAESPPAQPQSPELPEPDSGQHPEPVGQHPEPDSGQHPEPDLDNTLAGFWTTP